MTQIIRRLNFRLVRWLNILVLTFCAAACAETPGGLIVMNEETIENFIEGDREGKRSWDPALNLNLLHDQPVIDANIPPVPPGMIRLAGVLNSAGPYDTTARLPDNFPGDASRGSTFVDSVFGKLGPAGAGGNAWLYVDIIRDTGAIAAARAYLYNFMGGVCDMRQQSPGGFGSFAATRFALYIDGPCLFPWQQGSTIEFALVVEGTGAPLDAAAGANFPVRYIVADSARFKEIPADPKAWGSIYDYGTGSLKLIK
ncbi:MAG: hypothetical protein K2H64_07055 [Desulfovibrio sp.]|nr:hypothetical protein [Desulfovibrio sp.]